MRRTNRAPDSRTGTRVLEALAAVNRDLGTTVLVITHNVVVGRMAEPHAYCPQSPRCSSRLVGRTPNRLRRISTSCARSMASRE